MGQDGYNATDGNKDIAHLLPHENVVQLALTVHVVAVHLFQHDEITGRGGQQRRTEGRRESRIVREREREVSERRKQKDGRKEKKKDGKEKER